MFNQKKIIEFFDGLAPQWDSNMIRNEEVISKILDGAGVSENKKILDVACGTGVLIPDYLARKIENVTAIDISPEMIKIASSKYLENNIEFICGDIMTQEFEEKFDCIMLYNAFPHFANPEELIKKLADDLRIGGKLTIAHGMSKSEIDKIHENGASDVSLSLMEAEELAMLMNKYLEVEVKISDDKMYQVTGRKV